MSFPLVAIAVLISYHFLDTPIAITAFQLLNSSISLRNITADIPDILFLLVCFGSALLWSSYLFHRQKKISNKLTHFYLIAGCAVPFAFLLKGIFKFIFGRTNTRAWLANRMDDGFNWFHGGEACSSFPSGHMTVFTAFFAAAWIIYPRYRPISLALLLLLALALIATDYHFLSDVIAGTYLGLVATCLSRICVNKVYFNTDPYKKIS